MTELAPLSDGLVKLEQIVKPLQWPDTLRRGQRVRSGHGLLGYTIAYYGGDSPTGPVIYRWAADEGAWSVPFQPFQTYDQAKAAAQAHYNEAVASALNLDPILSEIKRMREALSIARNYLLDDNKLPRDRYAADDLELIDEALSTLSPQEPDNG